MVPDEGGYDPTRLNLPPTHRLNAGASLNGRRFLGDLAVHRATDFWSDILTSDYHGYSPGYTCVNASAGLKWRDGRVTTLVRITNLLNRTVQQHIFGDLLRPLGRRRGSLLRVAARGDRSVAVLSSRSPQLALLLGSASRRNRYALRFCRCDYPSAVLPSRASPAPRSPFSGLSPAFPLRARVAREQRVDLAA